MTMLGLPLAVGAPPLEGGGFQHIVIVRQYADVLDADAVGDCHGSPTDIVALRRRFASVEPFGVDDAFLLVITQRIVKRLHLFVVWPYHQLQFFDAALAQPIFRRGHDRAP